MDQDYEKALLGETCGYLNNGITCSEQYCFWCSGYRKHQQTIFCIPETDPVVLFEASVWENNDEF